MFEVREARIEDVNGIREVFESTYGEHYAYPQYYDQEALSRLVYTDESILLVAADRDSQRIAGTASVVFSVGAHNDLVGEFGRLVVHPDFRGHGIGTMLMEGRVRRVESRLHLGLVENRAVHPYSQRISEKFGFRPVGFGPLKLRLDRRESVVLYARHFGDALSLRRNNPRVIEEVSELAGLALESCGLPRDPIIDDSSAPYPPETEFQLEELRTAGYSSLLRIERGRVKHRDVFGPIRLHYGLFQLKARHSDYLLARSGGQIVGGIGYMFDEAEKAVRVFELISNNDEPIHFLWEELIRKCREELDVEYLEVDVSAYSPRMQRTLLELDFLPVSYAPANVFHDVERLDAVKMVRLFVPLDIGEIQVRAAAQPLVDCVLRRFAAIQVLPRIAEACQQLPLFDRLNTEQRDRIFAICAHRQWSVGATVYQQGEAGRSLHVVLSGRVSLLAGDSKQVGEVATGQCLGESVLLEDSQSPHCHRLTAIAAEPLETAIIDRQEFLELIRRRPDIGLVIYRNLAKDVSRKLETSAATPILNSSSESTP